MSVRYSLIACEWFGVSGRNCRRSHSSYAHECLSQLRHNGVLKWKKCKPGICEVLSKIKKFAKSRDNLNGVGVLPAEPLSTKAAGCSSGGLLSVAVFWIPRVAPSISVRRLSNGTLSEAAVS